MSDDTETDVIRVAVLGAAGRMGTAVVAAVTEADGLDLVAAVDPGAAGTTLQGCAVLADTADLDASAIDVVIDFTHPDAARANLAWAAAAGVHAVVGTSGFTEAEIAGIAAEFTASSCLIVPNFAIGAVLMMRFAAVAAPFFDTAEIIELHHDNKVDAPSGTAVRTAEQMAAASTEWAEDPTRTETIAHARGAVGPAGIPIHSVRMRGMIAHQEVLLGAAGQTLSIRHDSYDRESFMPGVVLAVRSVADRPGVTVGLESALGLG